MKKFMILAIILILSMVSIIGCSSKSDIKTNAINNNQSLQSQQTNKEEETFKEEVAKYGELLTSGKTYENMDSSERTSFSEVADDLDKFTKEFKEKYKSEIDRIQKTREESVAKWESEKKENKSNETNKRENVIGTSNKNFSNITSEKPHSIINDKTGNCKFSRISTSENVLEYISSYYKNNFTNSNEIHFIVNYTLKTTTRVSKMLDNVLVVNTYEHVDKEELDAKKLCSGMELGEYWIYLDNGDIQKIK